MKEEQIQVAWTEPGPAPFAKPTGTVQLTDSRRDGSDLGEDRRTGSAHGGIEKCPDSVPWSVEASAHVDGAGQACQACLSHRPPEASRGFRCQGRTENQNQK